MQRTRIRSRLVALPARWLALALAFPCRSAAGYDALQFDGAANSGYSQASHGRAESFTEVRPALTLGFVSPRVTWRAGYAFAGQLTLLGDRVLSVSNEANLTMASELSSRSSLLLNAGVSQGGTQFQLTHKAPEAGQPAFRAPTNPALVTAAFEEAYQRESSAGLRLRQALTGTLVAPQDALGRLNASAFASIGFDRERSGDVGRRDALGAELRSGGAALQSSTSSARYWSLTNALVGNWAHDFSPGWSGQAAGGVEQVLTFTGSYPLAIIPTGNLAVQYTSRDSGGALAASYGALSDLQTGIVSVTQTVTLRGVMDFEAAYSRTLGVSVGLLHAEPLGESTARAGAGTGYAVQADIGLRWGFSDAMLASARYAIAYQFAQPNAVGPSLSHVLLVGITVRYSRDRMPAAPSFGERVDRSDRAGFPEVGSKKR